MSDLFLLDKRTDGITVITVRDLSPTVLGHWNHLRTGIYRDALRNGRHVRILCDLREAGWLADEHIDWVAQSFSPESSELWLRRSIALLTEPVALGLTEKALGRLPATSKVNARAFLTEADAIRWLNSRKNGEN